MLALFGGFQKFLSLLGKGKGRGTLLVSLEEKKGLILHFTAGAWFSRETDFFSKKGNFLGKGISTQPRIFGNFKRLRN